MEMWRRPYMFMLLKHLKKLIVKIDQLHNMSVKYYFTEGR